MAGERLKAMLATLAPVRPRTVMEKFQVACELHKAGIELMRQNLRRNHPEASEADIGELLVAWLRRERA